MSAITDLLGNDADKLLNYTAKGFKKESLHLPGPDFVDRIVAQTDRCPNVLRNFNQIINHGRLAGTGYVSILPVDQGIEHSAGASFAANPIVLRSAEYREAGRRRRLQRGGVDAGRPGIVLAEILPTRFRSW